MGDVGDYWREAREYRKWGPGYRRKVKPIPRIKDFACPVCSKKFETQEATEMHIRTKRGNGDVPHRDYLRKLKGETPSYRTKPEPDIDDDDWIPF